MISLKASPLLHVEGSTPHPSFIVPHFWGLTGWVWQFSRAEQGDAEYHSHQMLRLQQHTVARWYWHLTRTSGLEIDTPIVGSPSDQQSDHDHGTGIRAGSV